MSSEPTLLLTRPIQQSNNFLRMCEKALGRSISHVISPLLQIEPADKPPNLDLYATIIFTSGNGVRSALEHTSLTGRTVVTVGEKTAVLARASGAEATSLGEDLECFVRSPKKIKGPALWCRGTHTRGDLPELLAAREIRIDEAVLYDQVSRPLSLAAEELLASEEPVIAPVFSPRTARLLASSSGITAPLTVIAMSQAVASEWTGDAPVLVADKPTSRAMAELTVSRF